MICQSCGLGQRHSLFPDPIERTLIWATKSSNLSSLTSGGYSRSELAREVMLAGDEWTTEDGGVELRRVTYFPGSTGHCLPRYSRFNCEDRRTEHHAGLMSRKFKTSGVPMLPRHYPDWAPAEKGRS